MGKKPKRVSLPRTMSPDEMTFEKALGLLALPRPLGKDPETGQQVYASMGRYGPYVRRDKTYKSLTKEDDILTVELPRALELLSQAKASSTLIRELGEHPDDEKSVTLNTGRYGPYVKHGRTNASLPKDMDQDSITLEMALELLSKKKSSKGKGTKKKTTAKKKKA